MPFLPNSQHVVVLRGKGDLTKHETNVLVSRASKAACCNVPFFLLAEHADILLHKAFLVGIYGQIDTSSMIAESMKVLHMEAT